MKHKLLFSAVVLAFSTFAQHAHADAVQFTFAGQGVSGNVVVTYGAARDAKYSQAYEVTAIGGTFSDTNIGISNATITGIVGLNRSPPEPTNLLAPNDFSHFNVMSGNSHGFISYDNLLWPGSSPQSATDYPFHGGFLDIYGLLFSIGNGTVVNIWSNGLLPGATSIDYGVLVSTSARQLDAVEGGVAVTPEPSTWCLLATAMLAVVFWRRESIFGLSA